MSSVLNVNEPIDPSTYDSGSAGRATSYTKLARDGSKIQVDPSTLRFVRPFGYTTQEVEIDPKTGVVSPIGPAQRRTAGRIRSIIEWRNTYNGQRYEELSLTDLAQSPIEKNISWNEFKCTFEGGKCDRPYLRQSDAISIVYFDHKWLRYLVHLPVGFRLKPNQQGDVPYEIEYRRVGVDYLLPPQSDFIQKDAQGNFVACATPPILIHGQPIGTQQCTDVVPVEIDLQSGTYVDIPCPELPNERIDRIRRDSDLLSEEEWRMYSELRKIKYPTRLALRGVERITDTERVAFQEKERQRLRTEMDQRQEAERRIFANIAPSVPGIGQPVTRPTLGPGGTMLYPQGVVRGIDANGNLTTTLPAGVTRAPVVGSMYTQTTNGSPCAPELPSDVPNLVEYGQKDIDIASSNAMLFNVTKMSVIEAAAMMPLTDVELTNWMDYLTTNQFNGGQINTTGKLLDIVIPYLTALNADWDTTVNLILKQRAMAQTLLANANRLRARIQEMPQHRPVVPPVALNARALSPEECYAELERTQREVQELRLREAQSQAAILERAQRQQQSPESLFTPAIPIATPSRVASAPTRLTSQLQ